MPFSFRPDPETEALIRRVAARTGWSKSQVVREAVAQYGAMAQPEIKFTTEVVNLGIFTDFMAKVGTLKNPPKDWKTEMVFPEAKVR